MPLYEISCASISSLVVSPIMTIIDTAIIQSQIKKIQLKDAVVNTINDYSTKRMKFNRPFGIMFFVYSSTYATANLTNLACKKMNIDYKIPTLIATSLVNIAAISYKDKEYTKLFNQTRNSFPRASYGLFALRDMTTIASSFIFKNDVANELNTYMPHNIADFIASMTVPMAMQLVSTPIHILSIDLYQRPTALFKDRMLFIRQMYKSVCSGRVMRVIPAFCIGGFINDMTRSRLT